MNHAADESDMNPIEKENIIIGSDLNERPAAAVQKDHEDQLQLQQQQVERMCDIPIILRT